MDSSTYSNGLTLVVVKITSNMRRTVFSHETRKLTHFFPRAHATTKFRDILAQFRAARAAICSNAKL